MSYVVNARIANPGQTRLVETAVRAAGGVVVQSWPQIGVVIAHSKVSTFRADVVAKGGNAVDSVGATRTVAVSEGTPEVAGASWGRGASGYKQGAKKAANGDLESDASPAVATDPREAEQWDMRMIKADQAHAITDGSRNVLVGVLDSGIDPDHPDLAANIDVADSVNCTDAGRPDLSATGWYPTTSDHGTHVAGTIAAARNGVGIVGVAPERADGRGQGRQRRRLHLPGVRRVRLHLGRPEAHGRDEQQLLRRPVRVLLRGPARPVRRQGGRASRRDVVDGAGCRPRGRRRQLGARPVGQVVVQGHDEP